MNAFDAVMAAAAASIGDGGGGRRGSGGAGKQNGATTVTGNCGTAVADAGENCSAAAIDDSAVEMLGVNAEVAHGGQG